MVLIVAWICQTLRFLRIVWLGCRRCSFSHGFSLVELARLVVDDLTWCRPRRSYRSVHVRICWERKWLITVVALIVAACRSCLPAYSFKTTWIITFGFPCGDVLANLRAAAVRLYARKRILLRSGVRAWELRAYGLGRLSNTVGPLLVAFLL